MNSPMYWLSNAYLLQLNTVHICKINDKLAQDIFRLSYSYTLCPSLRHLTLAFTVDGVGVATFCRVDSKKGGKRKNVSLQVNTILIYEKNMHL